MKIVSFKSGLGNQIYFYLFSRYLQKKYPNQKIYGSYLKKYLVAHNGIEIQNVFDVKIPRQTQWSRFVAFACRMLNSFGVKGMKSTDDVYDESAVYFDGYWQDKKFFGDALESLHFKKFEMNEQNTRVLELIKDTQSICLHVRRGDYLAPQNKPIYGRICTLDYYRKGIQMIKENFADPHFFIFSNDIDWVKENLDVHNATFITWNQGKNSFMDLYLMTFCKGAIIANSSFSYWGSMLNVHKTPFVVYPEKWWNTLKVPDIFPEFWIGI